MIPYGRQDVTEADIAAVAAVLQSDFLTQGPAIPRFEAALRQATAARHAVAVSSATAALHIAYLAAGVGPEDIVWTVPNTFVATANAALYCGATVDFVDTDPATYTMSPAALEAKLAIADKAGRLPKLIVPVAFAGQSPFAADIAALACRYGIHVIEDGSHAIGGSYDGAPIGAGKYALATCFSFHPVKIVTTGEGGAVVTNDDAFAQKCAMLRTHGITRDTGLMRLEVDGPWYYEQLELGFNYRITDIQAALGTSQFDRLAAYVDRRHVIRERYDAAFAQLPGVIPPAQDPRGRSALHLYPIRWREAETGSTRRQAFEAMRKAGIGVNVHYIPVHLQPYYRDLGFAPGDAPEAEAYYSEAISLPMFPTLTEADQDHVIATVKRLATEGVA